MDELVKSYVAYSEQQETKLKESRKSYDLSKLITSVVLRHPQGLHLAGESLIISLLLRELVSNQEDESLIEEHFSSLSKFELDQLFKQSHMVFTGLGALANPFADRSSLTYQSTAPGYIFGQLPWERAIAVLLACVKVNSYEQGNYELELPVLLSFVEAVKEGQAPYPALLFELAQRGALSHEERMQEVARQQAVVQARLLQDEALIRELAGETERGVRVRNLREYASKLRALAPQLDFYALNRSVDQFALSLKTNTKK